jgi:DNA-binding transcriptional LysR family regulator
MDLRHLRAFRATMLYGSTVGAARTLGVSQPSISRLLAELERDLGRPLFVRANGRLVARDSAEALLPDVERALARIDDLFAGAAHDARPLRIAAPAGVVARLIGPAVALTRRDVPNLRVQAEILSYNDTLDAVASGRSDVGFVKAPVSHPAVTANDLVAVGTDVVLPACHRLAKRDEITPMDLAGEPLVLLGRHRPFRVDLEDEFARAGVDMCVVVETQAVSAACSFVREGLGVTVANALLARAEAGSGLVSRPFRSGIEHRFCLIQARNAERSRMLGIFVGHMREVVAAILRLPDVAS